MANVLASGPQEQSTLIDRMAKAHTSPLNLRMERG
ncbi:TPA_asm: hypothetical protein [Microviridae sp.]|nr:TPA_asm: hypothetical protein [Microviridae sp.]